MRAWANLYPWDVDGDPAAADRIAGLGLTGVTLAAAYHAVRAVTPFHPAAPDRHQGRGGLLPRRSVPLAGRPARPGQPSRGRARPGYGPRWRRPARSSVPPPRCAPAAWR